ncbi:hypothetical protein FDECE_4313 [Fusarium decemcellulare]|nr:hypothetical protein FDECE_4313 [Fusarium decemcellulare]
MPHQVSAEWSSWPWLVPARASKSRDPHANTSQVPCPKAPLPPVAIDAIEGCEQTLPSGPRRQVKDDDQDHDVRRGPSSTGHGPSAAAGTRHDPHAPAQSPRHDASGPGEANGRPGGPSTQPKALRFTRVHEPVCPVSCTFRRLPPLARSSVFFPTPRRKTTKQQEKPETTRTGPGTRAAGVGVERTQLARSDASHTARASL